MSSRHVSASFKRRGPYFRTASSFAGNQVLVRIRRGVYAAYGHMQAGSVRVRRGQRVRKGQVIGLLGNSGNTSAPHLHFGIQDGPSFTSSNSLPFEFDDYRLQGVAAPGAVNIIGTPRGERRSYPLITSIATYDR